jgi:prephenate dehydrogenase
MKKIETLAIIGVGLIGGSLSLALKQTGAVGRVIGVGRSRANLQEALDLNVIDEIGDLIPTAQRADVIFIATPVAQMPAIFQTLSTHAKPQCVVFDGGSTKQDVVAAARMHLGARVSRFVPSHPIAGTEKTGASAAFATLYQQRKAVVCPMPETDADAREQVDAIWRACGADVRTLSAQQHDEIFAAVSHVPHVLAFALVDELAQSPLAPEYFDYAASGFRDFTRIAAGSPEMWRDISFANKAAIRNHIARFRAVLDQYDAWLAADDAERLNAGYTRASEARRKWQAAIERGESPRNVFSSE